MLSMAEQLIHFISHHPGISDRELTDFIQGKGKHPSRVNQEARLLEGRGVVVRSRRPDGVIGNYLQGTESVPLHRDTKSQVVRTESGLSEDELKEVLHRWLTQNGWQSQVAWAKARGVDIRATREGQQWLIEVKGLGSRQAMRVNYFIAILGETLQRMADPAAKYSIALPDVPQFRGLWERLPALAKSRTAITALFVTPDGLVTELS